MQTAEPSFLESIIESIQKDPLPFTIPGGILLILIIGIGIYLKKK
ncbi:MAG: hypothetical protein BAJALOKI1v1_190013 [Promethearchaeota archaeon]|nr:MAG: hypothetical protein BAJALOKI1v1_190013 [Candidatus Lokiarchaeota archaeon]